MAGAATALRADVWTTTDSLAPPGVERAAEGAVQRWIRVQHCAHSRLRGFQRSSRPSAPIATIGAFHCSSQELPPSHGLRRRRSGLLLPQLNGLIEKAGVRETAKAVLAGSEEPSVWRRRVIGGGSGGQEGNAAESRFSFGGATKCSPRTVKGEGGGSYCAPVWRLWLMAAERERRGFALRATRTPSSNVREEEDKKKFEEEMKAFVRPKLPGDEPDFWEGEQWDWLGFTLQYLWAVGIVIALIGGLVAVRTYNYGAVDYKDTVEYQSAMDIIESTKEGAGESESQSSLPIETLSSLSSPAPSE